MSVQLLLLAAAGVLGGSDARAASASRLQAHGEIIEAVKTFVLGVHRERERVRVLPSPLDPRLRLARCAQAMEVDWAPGSDQVGSTTVSVRCAGRKSWKLYVPTRVSVMAPVAVASRPLARGQRIGPGDLKLVERDLATTGADAVRDPSRVAGYVVTRAIAGDRVVGARMLAAPRLVERGQRVRVLLSTPGLQISMTGVALDDGAQGERVRIRNPVSNRTVDAKVVRAGLVRLAQ